MKGMLDFLEKAGLVRRDDQVPTPVSARSDADAAAVAGATVAVAAIAGATSRADLSLEQIYADEGVSGSAYPAERLLRVVDGLSAMDEATRNVAIRAIDAADDSWSIADPLSDAAAKVNALTAHAARVQSNLQQFELETKGRLEASRSRQEKVVGDIRKQIGELEALASREMARAAQESATQEANLATARDQATRELAQLADVSRRLQSLASQFGSFATTSTR